MPKWTQSEIEFLVENYPIKGKKWCMDKMNKSDGQIRQKASDLKLRQNRDSAFFRDWQERAAKSKIGKKRPDQAIVMKRTHELGLFKKTDAQKKAISDRVKKQWTKIPHPKGMLGKKHSNKTLEKISEASKTTWANMTEEERDKRAMTASINARKSITNRETASWKAGWREIGGKRKYFRSRWEANYARYLEWLKQIGEITEWEHEPETFWFEGIKRGCLSYLPDFRVIENNKTITYHEVKGWMDDRSRTKIKRMAKYHPTVKLIIIEAKQYKEILKKVSAIIPEWET